jgi:cysteine-rich repeat protein
MFVSLFLAACTSSNQNGVCGDGVRDPGEECDDGNLTNGDGCSASCTIQQVPPACGNGHVDTGETCDDGNTTSGDGCSATCQTESICGDSHVTGTEQCDDGNTQSSDGCSATCETEVKYATTASWAFKSFQTSGNLACPTGFDTAAVYSQLVDANGTAIGSPTIDLFNCADGTGTITPLYQGVYLTWIAITNTNGSLTYAQSTSAYVDLSTGDKTFSADIYEDGGYFAWKWNLQGAASNNPLTCAQAGATSADLLSTVTSGTQSYDDVFTCTDGQGITSALPAGSYTVSMSALNSSDQALGTPVNMTNKLIQAPNRVTDLGTVTLLIDGM